MRIEPTTKSFPRQSSKRRHQADALNMPKGEGSFTNDASNTQIEGKAMITVNGPNHSQTRLSSERWRAFVPFIAHYIGQETAVETPARYARRHIEFAQKTYRKQDYLTARPRTISLI